MKTIKKSFCLAITALLCVAVFFAAGGLVVPTFADSLAPQSSYKIELENGEKFFYMRGSELTEEDDEDFLDLDSGLYFSDTLENIYTIEPVISYEKAYPRYIYQTSLVISQDGMCFANLPWTANQGIGCVSKSGTAVEFYNNGSLIKQYDLSDLTKNKLKFKYSVSHVLWENRDKREFDASNNTLSVTTLNNKTVIFDLTSGSIVSKKLSGGEIAEIIILSVLGIAALTAVGFKIYKARKKKSIKKTTDTAEIL